MTDPTALLDDDRFEASTPEVRIDALARHYGDEAVVWSPVASAPVHLDAVAALVFQMLDGQASVADLIVDVHEVLGVPRVIARNQLRRVVSLLDRGALLTTSALADADAHLDFFPAPPNP